jgi:hypothetical protein
MDAVHRRVVYDCCAGRRAPQRLEQRVRELKCGAKVDVDHLGPIRVAEALEQLERNDARVVHENVDAAVTSREFRSDARPQTRRGARA